MSGYKQYIPIAFEAEESQRLQRLRHDENRTYTEILRDALDLYEAQKIAEIRRLASDALEGNYNGKG